MAMAHSETSRALAGIVALMSDYFDGLYFSDTDSLRRVFHPRAHYVCASGATLQYLTMDDYFPIVDARPSPASRNEVRRDRIVSVEFAGPATALVRAECAIGEKHFSDLLSLVRADGRWPIVSKVFHYDLT